MYFNCKFLINRTQWIRLLRLLNCFGKLYALSIAVTMLYAGITVRYSQGLSTFLWSLCVALYFLYNMFGNWYIFSKKLSEKQPKYSFLPLKHGEDVYCSKCEMWVTVNSHHCDLCRKCIINRDHHCFFLGGCVGSDNLDNFIAFCFHACCSCAFGLYVFLQYLSHEYNLLARNKLSTLFIPVAFWQWSAEIISFAELGLILLSNLCVSLCIATGGLYVFHVFLACLGQTRYELQKQILNNQFHWCDVKFKFGIRISYLLLPSFQ